MKKINYVKYALDLIVGIIFALFYNKNVLGGLAFHEIAGLVICGAFLTHILLNFRWVKNVTLKLFDRKLPGKTRFSFLLSLLLLVTMTTVIITGLFISKVVFPNLNIGNERWFHMLHLFVSYLTLIIVAVHIGLQWKWVMNVSRKIFKIRIKSKALSYSTKLATVLILLFGAYEIYATGFASKITGSANLFTNASVTNMEKPQGDEGFGGGHFNGERPSAPDRAFQGKGNLQERSDGGFHGGHGGNSSAIGVIITYSSIMAVFIILTHYLGKIKRKNKIA